MQQDFDPNSWNCPCGGVSDVYRMNSPSGEFSYYLMECMTCGVWRRFVPEMGEQEIGKELPEEIRDVMDDERCEKIRAAPDPLKDAVPTILSNEEIGDLLDKDKPHVPQEAPIPQEASDSQEAPVPEVMSPLDDPMHMEQGAMMDCRYCRDIYPDLKGECPSCRGGGPSFRPARMMDKETSLREVLPGVLGLWELELKIREAEESDQDLIKHYRNALIRTVEEIGLYDFNIKDALVQRIRDLDQEFEIDPKKGV